MLDVGNILVLDKVTYLPETEHEAVAYGASHKADSSASCMAAD